eukprot:Sdes_comp20982_c0_seq1m19309
MAREMLERTTCIIDQAEARRMQRVGLLLFVKDGLEKERKACMKYEKKNRLKVETFENTEKNKNKKNGWLVRQASIAEVLSGQFHGITRNKKTTMESTPEEAVASCSCKRAKREKRARKLNLI